MGIQARGLAFEGCELRCSSACFTCQGPFWTVCRQQTANTKGMEEHKNAAQTPWKILWAEASTILRSHFDNDQIQWEFPRRKPSASHFYFDGWILTCSLTSPKYELSTSVTAELPIATLSTYTPVRACNMQGCWLCRPRVGTFRVTCSWIHVQASGHSSNPLRDKEMREAGRRDGLDKEAACDSCSHGVPATHPACLRSTS
eukprot:357516-Chlamydomonas_euryale.AAC.12